MKNLSRGRRTQGEKGHLCKEGCLRILDIEGLANEARHKIALGARTCLKCNQTVTRGQCD